MDNLANAVFRAMESSVWLGYAVVARNFGIATNLDIPTLLKIERECLLKYDRIRGEIEIGLSEYWGHIGNDDDEFTNLIIKYRKCTLLSDYSALKFQSKEEVNDFNVPMHVSKIREQLEADIVTLRSLQGYSKTPSPFHCADQIIGNLSAFN